MTQEDQKVLVQLLKWIALSLEYNRRHHAYFNKERRQQVQDLLAKLKVEGQP